MISGSTPPMLRSPRAQKVTGLQDHLFGRLALAGIGIGREFRLAEHVHDAVVADAVAGAEILVRVVVEAAPADGAGNVRIAVGRVEHLEMAAHMLGLALLLIVAFGRVHVPAVFGDHDRGRPVEAGAFLLVAQRRARSVAARSSSLPRMKSFIV